MESNQNINNNQQTPELPTQPQISDNSVTPEVTQTIPDTPSSTDNPTPPTPSSPLKKPNKLLRVVPILIVLGLLGIAGYMLSQNQTIKYKLFPTKTTPTPVQTVTSSPTPTSDPTKDWKSYSNSADNYSFKYPADMILSDYNEGSFQGIQLIIIGPTQTAGGRTQSSLAEGAMIKTLLIPNTSAKSEAESMRQKELSVPEGDTPPKVSEIKEVVLNGVKAYQYISEGMGNVKVTYIPINSNTLRLAGYYAGFNTDQILQYEKLVDQILSTFMFCGTCPQLVAPKPGFCEDGTVIPGKVNQCGCQGPPVCITK